MECGFIRICVFWLALVSKRGSVGRWVFLWREHWEELFPPCIPWCRVSGELGRQPCLQLGCLCSTAWSHGGCRSLALPFHQVMHLWESARVRFCSLRVVYWQPVYVCEPAPWLGRGGSSGLFYLGRGQQPFRLEGWQAGSWEGGPLALQCCAWWWFAGIRKGCHGYSLLLSVMTSILRIMARFSLRRTAGSQAVRWSVMPLNWETISLLDNSDLGQALRACPELLSCTVCLLCSSVISVTGSAAEQKPLNSFIGGQVLLFVSILKGRAMLFLFSGLARMLNMC